MTMTTLRWARTLAVAEPDHFCCSYLLRYKYINSSKMEKYSPSRHFSWARACRIKVGQACHGWNVNSWVSNSWGDWAPHKPCGAGHGIRMQERWQLCRTPEHLIFVKENIIPISWIPPYFIFLCTSPPFFYIHFSFLLLAVLLCHSPPPFFVLWNPLTM